MELFLNDSSGFRTVSFQKVVKLVNGIKEMISSFRTVSFQKVVKQLVNL